jgi:hypothetical protein
VSGNIVTERSFSFSISHLTFFIRHFSDLILGRVLLRGSFAWLKDENDPRNYTNAHKQEVNNSRIPIEK